MPFIAQTDVRPEKIWGGDAQGLALKGIELMDNEVVEAEGQVVALGHDAQEKLKRYIDRIERLEEEKADLQRDVRELYGEAKQNGFDVKALRALIALRKKDEHQREEEESMLTLYMHALGMAPTA